MCFAAFFVPFGAFSVIKVYAQLDRLKWSMLSRELSNAE